MVLQRIRIAAIVRIEADADAARDVELVHLDEKRPRQLVEDLATDHRRILGSADAAEQNDELVAAGARHRVGGAHAGRQSLRDILQEPIADPMRSDEHTTELQSLLRRSYAVLCVKKT